MQMIDVLKRLAALDAKNPTIVKECGGLPEMGMGGMAPDRPSTPASINITAGSGDELSAMLRDIMTLAGVKQQGEPEAPMDVAVGEPAEVEPAVAMAAGPAMRSVIDRLNPDGDVGDGDADADDGMSVDDGDLDNDGDHDMDDHDQEKKEPVDEYDNSPADPNDVPEFDSNKYAHRENQPGQGDRMDGTQPKAFATMEEALFADYKKFVNESKTKK